MENETKDVFAMLRSEEASTTENGAKGFRTAGNALLDLSYLIPEFRRGEFHMDLFHEAINKYPSYTLKWLLYLRDIRFGCGERNAFRVFLTELCNKLDSNGLRFIKAIYIEDYGRWDDWLYVYSHCEHDAIKNFIGEKLSLQLVEDLISPDNPSLLAKWLPSESSHNNETKMLAKELRKKYFNFSAREYRKALSKLRKTCAPTEVKMSAREWNKVDYEQVPSVANLKYRNAFYRHDAERRARYLEDLKNGKAKVNANAAFLYDIVKQYAISPYSNMLKKEPDTLLEEMWKTQDKIEGFHNTLVIRDGSSSMGCAVGNSNITALNVTDALSIYCAEQNTGAWHNRILTFSAEPQTIELQDSMNLLDKLKVLHQYTDYTNTNIEKTFDLLLDVAVKNALKQEDLPNMLIISDMEFDTATGNNPWESSGEAKNDKLFEVIADKFAKHGYKLPKLIFWNVNSRSNTIPVRENDLGVILVSGFNKNILNMVVQNKNDPWEALKDILDSPRYEYIDGLFV